MYWDAWMHTCIHASTKQINVKLGRKKERCPSSSEIEKLSFSLNSIQKTRNSKISHSTLLFCLYQCIALQWTSEIHVQNAQLEGLKSLLSNAGSRLENHCVVPFWRCACTPSFTPFWRCACKPSFYSIWLQAACHVLNTWAFIQMVFHTLIIF